MEAQYASVWEKNSDVIPDKIALICGDNEVTWREYDQRAAKLATLLTNAGLGDDSKVGLYLHSDLSDPAVAAEGGAPSPPRRPPLRPRRPNAAESFDAA